MKSKKQGDPPDPLDSLGLSKETIQTYRRYLAETPEPRPVVTYASLKPLAKKLGLAPGVVQSHISSVKRALKKSTPRKPQHSAQSIEDRDPEMAADILMDLSSPGARVAETARKLGVPVDTVRRLRQALDEELLPLKRELADVRLEEMIQRFGTLSRDALDAITPEKLAAADAKALAIIAGIGAEKWQLFRGQPTQRMEIHDRREMNELLGEILKEAKRRNIEIDITAEGVVTAQPSPYRDAFHKRVMKQIESGDPAETLTPA